MAPPTGGIVGEEGDNNASTDERQQQSNDNTTDADGSPFSNDNTGNNSNNRNSSTSNNQPPSSPRRDRDTLARISSWAPIGSAREQRAAAAEARQRIASASATTRNDDNNNNNNDGGNNNPPRSNRNIAAQGPPPLPRAIREFAARNNNTATATNNNTNGGITRLPFDPDEVIDDIPPLSMRDDSSSSSNDTSSMQDLIRRERVAEIRRRRRVIEIIDSSSDEEYSDVPELVDVGEDEIPPARSASANPYATITLSNSRAGTTTTGRDRTTATATTGTSTTGGPGGGTGSEDRMPGLRRIMNRLMFQTLSARGILPPGITSEEDMLDENGETRDPVDLLSMFDDAFMDVNPTTDVRKPDQLVCPTCMRVHLPVEGSERIAIPKEEGAETDDDYHTADHGDDGSEDYSGSEESSVLPPLYSDTESVDNNESLDSLPPLVPQNRSELDDNHDASLNASNLTIPGDRVLSPTNGVGNLNASNLTARAVIHDAPPQDRPVNVDEIFPGFEREMETLSHEITSQLYEMAQQSRVTTTAGDDDVLSRNNESSEGSSMPSLETVDQGDNREGTANTATAANNNNNNENEAVQDPSGENRDADTVPLNLSGNPMNSNNEEGPPSNLEVPSVDGQDDDEVLSQMSDMPPLEDVPEEPPANNNNNETATRNDNIDVAGENEENSVGGSSTSSPLPPLISRSRSGSSSSSMPPLIQRDFSSSESSGSMPALVRSTAAMNRAERGARDQGGGGFSIRNRMFSGFMPPAPRSRTADKKKTNPITHLRDYGALRVYATATCPICLDVHEPIVALPCGHCICVEDYKLLGGYLASDKEKIKKEAGIKADIPRGPRPPPPVRGTAWAHCINTNCQNPACNMLSPGTHCSLYSINDPEYGGLRYEKCYPIGTRIVPDGHGGLWIHEGKRLGDTINWPLLHRSKHGRETRRFSVPRNCDLEPDGNGGVWAISRPDQEPDNNHISEVTRYLVANEEDGGVIKKHAAYAPEGTDTFYGGGRGGKVWVAVQADDDYDFNEEQKNQMLDDGLWLVGNSSCVRVDDISGDIGFSTGDVDPDGHGGLWLLEESSELDDLVLKHYNHRGELRVAPFRFPVGGTEVYACDRTDSVFVYYQITEAEDHDHDGELMYIFRRNGDWASKIIGEQLPSIDGTKFVSTGDGELWGMTKDVDNDVKFWKCTSTEMQPLPYEWPLCFSETEMTEG